MTFIPFVTNSVPTLILGLQMFLYRSSPSTPKHLATALPAYPRDDEQKLSHSPNNLNNHISLKFIAISRLPLSHLVQLAPHDPFAWISWHPYACKKQWSCKCCHVPGQRSSELRRLPVSVFIKNQNNEQLWTIQTKLYLRVSFSFPQSHQWMVQ